MISNLPVSTVMRYSTIAQKTIQPIGNRPNAAPIVVELTARPDRHVVDTDRDHGGGTEPGQRCNPRGLAQHADQQQQHEDR